MSKADKLKWDDKYSHSDHQIENGEASSMLKRYYDRAPGQRALDVACGTGRNALFLASQGFQVDALDISPVGLKWLEIAAAKNSGTGQVYTQEVDLEAYSPAEATYDLIVVTNYLNRPLIPKLVGSLVKRGILVIDTFMADTRNEATGRNPEYLLKKGELPTYFDDGHEILKYKEFYNGHSRCGMWKQAIAVQKAN